MDKQHVNIFWFRRDLRLDDNTGLNEALKSGLPVLPLFIFDENITTDLPPDDARISFIYELLKGINIRLEKYSGSLCIKKGVPEKIFEELTETYIIRNVFVNKDYEPYAIERDKRVSEFLATKSGTLFRSFKDQVIFEGKEIINSQGDPFTVFTHYRNKWISEFNPGKKDNSEKILSHNFLKTSFRFPSLEETGFTKTGKKIRMYDLSCIKEYDRFRDYPAEDKTTYLGQYLRFGAVSIRSLARIAYDLNKVFLDELIWREFFMQVLYNFPQVVTGNFRRRYDNITWRNNESEFQRWCNGETGYPLVDAGMRQMNETGYMHNRVRMVTASFLCKHLLIDWRLGEALFAEKLNDYELASNNGNWQWNAGTGCDAAPYFRIFNPVVQAAKFDKQGDYVRRWLGDNYKITPVVDHDYARQRALKAYSDAVKT